LIVIGTVIGAAGLAWLSRISPTSTFMDGLFGPFVLIGLGMGLTVTPVTVAGTAGVPREDAGLASGLLNTSRTIGASIGLAALATVAADKTTNVLRGAVVTHARTAVALTDGYALAIGIASVILLLAGIVALATFQTPRKAQEASAELTHDLELEEALEG
jgi:hypothetical protein